MNTFIGIIESLKKEISLHPTYSRWYNVNDNPNIQLKITSPSLCDSYADVIARITLFVHNQPVFDKLITVDTDLKKLYEKLKKKIKTSEIQERIKD